MVYSDRKTVMVHGDMIRATRVLSEKSRYVVTRPFFTVHVKHMQWWMHSLLSTLNRSSRQVSVASSYKNGDLHTRIHVRGCTRLWRFLQTCQ